MKYYSQCVKTISLIALALFIITVSPAQETFPVNGISNKNHLYYAFTNATIFIDYKTTITGATLLIKDNLIVAVAPKMELPKGTVVYNLNGKYIYPSLIDAYTNYGMPEIKPATQQNKIAANWNAAIKPETQANQLFSPDFKLATELRKIGFGTVLSTQKDGIVRGSGCVVSLDEASSNSLILKDKAATCFSFNKGSSTQEYPSSQMGAIALIRQTYLDARWYKNCHNNTEYNIALNAFNANYTLPQIFEADDKLSVLRADKIGDEFKIQYIIKGSGDEYQRVKAIKKTLAKLIIPLNFPLPYNISDTYDASSISLEELKHWEMAPGNPSMLEKNTIPFAISTSDIKNLKDFWPNLLKAIEYGLSEQEALKSLTYTPAEMLNIADKTGSLSAGLLANFIITSGNIFDKQNIIYENWTQGKQHIINNYNIADVRGNYTLNVGTTKPVTLKIAGELNIPTANIVLNDTLTIPVSITIANHNISLNYSLNSKEGLIRLSGSIAENPLQLKGNGQLENGEWITFSTTFINPFVAEKKDTLIASHASVGEIIYPFNAYGEPETKANKNYNAILIKNITIWTNEAAGVLKSKDVYISDGKIMQIDSNITPNKNALVKIINGTGKHLTAGIIDEHSHIAISNGVNESGQASTAEVRIDDVIDSEDINIYRQLAGGVTAAQLLHGSANPIGGQSALIKLRWGKEPEEFKIKGADGFIKFALGENVKQSNWGNHSRFPQSRMGVEQFYYNAFINAKEYDKSWKTYEQLSLKEKTKLSPPRRDLDLETLAEILNKKRFITCHSYVQSEINMLMHLADSLHFKINTFTHTLEGYKVADKMQQHGVGAATFSDWWAYKMEVIDAIPYNAAILNNMGLVTAINSDDPEMGRRLNQEAAKAIKYGGLSEEEALKLVTLNPAKLLHLDAIMGSIKTGKDADVVLWSDNPLSIYAKAEKTIIDGIIYFDIEQDVNTRNNILKERARLIQKMLNEINAGSKTQSPSSKKKTLYHCDTEGE